VHGSQTRLLVGVAVAVMNEPGAHDDTLVQMRLEDDVGGFTSNWDALQFCVVEHCAELLDSEKVSTAQP
jgi:hypothetical protein